MQRSSVALRLQKHSEICTATSSSIARAGPTQDEEGTESFLSPVWFDDVVIAARQNPNPSRGFERFTLVLSSTREASGNKTEVYTALCLVVWFRIFGMPR